MRTLLWSILGVLLTATAAVTTGAADQPDGWLPITTAVQYRLFEDMNKPTIVLFATANCASCQAVKSFWQRHHPSADWLWLYWEDDRCGEITGSTVTDATCGDVIRAQLAALGFTRQSFSLPLIIVHDQTRRAYFVGYGECTSNQPGWTESQFNQPRQSLSTWLSGR